MSIDSSLYENMKICDYNLPVIFHKDILHKEVADVTFTKHWHEKIEFLYFTNGEAIIECNAQTISAKPGDLIVINSNELHEGHALSNVAEYYCMIVDTALFQSRSIDICETKYIKPIYQNNIIFENKIQHDENIKACMENIVNEYETKAIGCEIAIKASIYQLFVILLRGYVKCMLTPREYGVRKKRLDRFNNILKFLDENYNEEISLERLCKIANLSRFRFCHLFKEATGKTFSEYLNTTRINKAEELLYHTDMNITEVALHCGFNDANYFSRVFKKYKGDIPSKIIDRRE